MPLQPQSLAEWAETDMRWWHELKAAVEAWVEGRQMIGETRRAIQQATAHMRTPKR